MGCIDSAAIPATITDSFTSWIQLHSWLLKTGKSKICQLLEPTHTYTYIHKDMPEVSLQIEPEREDSEYCASKVNMILKQYLTWTSRALDELSSTGMYFPVPWEPESC